MADAPHRPRRYPALAVVEEPGAASLLSDLRYIETLCAFLAQSRTLSDVAAEADLHLGTVYHRAQRLVAAGLLEVDEVRPRAGRALRLYRSSADAFFVPFRATPFATLRELTQILLEAGGSGLARDTAAALERVSPSWGLRLERLRGEGDRTGSHNITLSPTPEGSSEELLARLLGPGTPAIFASSGSLRLRPEDAESLQRELAELQRRYLRRSDPKGRAYHVRLAMAPARQAN